MSKDPVILLVALNGYEKKRINPLTPVEPAQVVKAALGSLSAGASLLHTHHEKQYDEVPNVVREYATR